ncbi:MAG TPA: MBL fold metallo-hydrolase [Thermodesulfobacteriota bacterium]|jgi:L-ascorbate metabolism protein UlaG (beta-lactamase superfamily)
MEVQYFGANCLVLASKKLRVVIDDNLAELGAKSIVKPEDIVLSTVTDVSQPQMSKIFINMPGEYEVSGISIYGIAARAHIDEAGKKTATVYKLIIDDLKVLVTGHIYPELTESQLEVIGMIDVMIVPVGGNGYTLDGVGALKLVKAVEPKVVVPVHYEDNTLRYPVPQQDLESALKSMSMEPAETTPKFKTKAADLGESLKLVVVERSK